MGEQGWATDKQKVMLEMHGSRLSQKWTFLSNQKFHFGYNFFSFFGSKAIQKTENWIFSFIFSTCLSHPKFYYITRLCEIGLTRKFNFFKVFMKRPCIFFSIINSKSKICSFEVHYVNMAQQITEWQRGDYCKYC